jgi:hypothetical protein
MRTRTVAAALLIALAPMTLTVQGFAQATDDPTIKAARARFNEGVEFFDKGQFENARASFLQAYALHKHPTVLLNLAQSSLRSGHSLEAAKYFQQFLRDSTGVTAAQKSDADKGLAEARTKLGRLEVSAPAGEEIFVDGDHAGTAPLSAQVDVEPGPHTVKANGDSKSVNVTAGQVLPVKFAVGGGVAPVPLPGNPEEPPPTVPPPSNPPEAPAAPPPEQPAAESGPGLFSPPRSMAPVWVGVTAAVVGTGTAVLFAIFKSSANSSYTQAQSEITSHYRMANGGANPPGNFCNNHPASENNYNGACANLASDANQVNTDATLGNVGVIVGVAGAAFGLGWYLFAPKRDAKDSSTAPTSSFAPVVSPQFKGLSYSLTF